MLPKRHKLPVALASLFFFFGLSVDQFETSSLPTFHRNVSEVRLTFFATDDRNRDLPILSKDDFAIVDNELIVRNFRSFSRADVTNLRVVILIDCSDSIRAQIQRQVTSAVELLLHTSEIQEDQVSVISFNGNEPRVLCDGNCRSWASSVRPFVMKTGGLTPLYQALALAGQTLNRHRDAEVRHVVLLFSDGEDTISRVSSADALEALRVGEAQVYAVDLNRGRPTSQGSSVLSSLTEATGGRYLVLSDGVPSILRVVLHDLHAGYIVTYPPPSQEAGFHAIRILPTRNRALRFRCRDGYDYIRPQSSNKVDL